MKQTYYPFLLLIFLVAHACARDPVPAIYPLMPGQIASRLDYEAVLKMHPMGSEQAVQVINLGRTQDSSSHLVRVRTRERLHRHRTHDATAVMLRGKGTLQLGKRRISMSRGDVVSIPQRAVHYFANEAAEPSVFYVIFAPPFDGKDRELLRSTTELLH